MTNTLRFAIHFAKFSTETGIHPRDLAAMIEAAERSVTAYERNDTAHHEHHGKTVEAIAGKYGCKVDWPGLWPCVEKIGHPSSNQLLPSYR